jgi:hypothetical protein
MGGGGGALVLAQAISLQPLDDASAAPSCQRARECRGEKAGRARQGEGVSGGVMCLGGKQSLDLDKACLPDTVQLLLLYCLHGLETPSPHSNPCHDSTLNHTHSTRAGSMCFSRLLFSRLQRRCLALCFGSMQTPVLKARI